MEGPAVKRFVTAPSISSSMSRSRYFSGGPERIPEDADARLTMERLRRRIRLICADYSEEQSRRTPLRRELPPSRGASRPGPKTGRRIERTRGLSSRARIAPWPTSLGNLGAISTLDRSPRPRWLRGGAPALGSSHGGPDEPHQFARDRRHGHRRSLAVADEMAVAAMAALLRPPRPGAG